MKKIEIDKVKLAELIEKRYTLNQAKAFFGCGNAPVLRRIS